MNTEPSPMNSALPPCAGSAFTWTGDLADDCWCRVGDLLAHVELMSDGIMCWQQDPDGDRESWVMEHWWFAVYRGNAEVFNSSTAGGMITTGDLARALAEAILKQNS